MIDFLLRPFRRNFGKDKRFYAAIDDMFGFIPNNIELYKLALIHKSASITMEDGRQVNNERLEYLGDAVIESVTSDYLFIEFPDKNEGFLTQLRSKMVSRQTLNEVAKRIGLNNYVISHTSNNSSQKHIYGDAFEAMMGAIYLDQGYDFVNRLLINKIYVDYIKVENLTEEETDFKSRLIEWCQKNHHQIYFSTHNDKNFSSTHPSFYSKVLIDNIEVGYGVGDSKKEAEQRAAYSVAQGVNDDDCTKLMDKLDILEAQELHPSKAGHATAKREKRETKEEKKRSQESMTANMDATEPQKIKAQEATEDMMQAKKSAPRHPKKAPKPQDTEASAPATNTANAVTEAVPTDNAESAMNIESVATDTKPIAKPKSRRVAKNSKNTATAHDAESDNTSPTDDRKENNPIEKSSATAEKKAENPEKAEKAAKAVKSKKTQAERSKAEKVKAEDRENAEKPKAEKKPRAKRTESESGDKSASASPVKIESTNEVSSTKQATTPHLNEESA